MKTALVQRALFLSWFTVGYNLIEGVVSIAFGVSEESLSLAGFGVDSLIEVASAALVLWRFRGESKCGDGISIEREQKATLGIGILFLILSFLTAIAALIQLIKEGHPETTLPGIVISLLSLSFMFFLWNAKKKLAIELDSKTVAKDADCSMACIKLSAVLFVGSLLFLILPQFWWADSVAALILSFLVGKEGWETVSLAQREDFSGGCGCS